MSAATPQDSGAEPGQTGPGQTGPGQAGPGQAGPGQTGSGPAETRARRRWVRTVLVLLAAGVIVTIVILDRHALGQSLSA
ncbi:MAG TPA: hypothetical protein VGY50_03070, partial [Streptosporangiaceae bacterium]|nr:hypothetical protein [Streptosporangiaceae bacterium]